MRPAGAVPACGAFTGAALLAGGTLLACATLGAILPLRFTEAPDRSSELRILAPSAGRPLGGAGVRLWARVENPNPIGVTLSQVAGELAIADAEAIAVDFPLGLPLVARQDTVIPLDVTLSFDDLPRLASIARSAITRGGRLDYRLDGTFAVDAGGFGALRFGPMTVLEGELRAR